MHIDFGQILEKSHFPKKLKISTNMTQNEIMMMGMENIHLKDVFKTPSLFGKNLMEIKFL